MGKGLIQAILVVVLNTSYLIEVIAQNSRSQILPGISLKVGDSLPSSDVDQPVPQITNVAAVAGNILSIEIDACQILPAVQIPYQPDSSDVITVKNYSSLGEKITMRVVRNGYPLGMLVGNDRRIITLHERIIGKHLDTNVADNPATYLMSSPGDPDFKKAISPEKVWRKSKPTNWTEENRHGGEFYTAKHYLYLKFPYALKIGQTYLIRFPGLNLNHSACYYVHDPLYVRSEAVHSSQIGFRSDDPDKNAFLSIWMGNGGGYNYPDNITFSLVNEKTNERVYTSKAVMQWKGSVPEGIGSKVNHSGTDVLRLDFSNFNTPGRYRVFVEGIGCGYPFDIDEGKTWLHAFEISMKGHYHQRSGIPILPPYSDFVRPRSFNPVDGVKVYQSTCSLLNSGNGLNALGTDKNNFGNLVSGKTDKLVPEAWGGVMDAGDWDRRINHLVAPRLYLELMELYPDYFKNICLNIPESANDLPDLVDEALFGLDVYRRMQLPDGGIRGGIESSEHPAEGSASWQEVLTVLAYAPDHWSGYLYSGVASRAAYVLKMLGKNDQASIWEKSAVKAMEWSENEYEHWISDPNYINVTERAKRVVPIERNLAAVELYRLTKDKRWHQVYLNTQHNEPGRSEAAFIYARMDPSMVSKKDWQMAHDKIIKEANRLVDLSGESAYGLTTSIKNRALGGWESTYSIPASPTLVRAHYLSKDDKYLKTVLHSALFSAGANPMNLCLTTGLGISCVKHPLHEDSRHTGQPAPSGITVCGPGEISVYAKPGSDMERRLNKECTPMGVNWPSAEAYFDLYGWDLQSEYVVDRNLGPTAFIWGYLASRENK